ncbi:hypothetical protein CEK25_004144 [Fusarium fujikuroi]|nr:hypothetical protein CEK25_004144 [Fusarium fujikuroi]
MTVSYEWHKVGPFLHSLRSFCKKCDPESERDRTGFFMREDFMQGAAAVAGRKLGGAGPHLRLPLAGGLFQGATWHRLALDLQTPSAGRVGSDVWRV